MPKTFYDLYWCSLIRTRTEQYRLTSSRNVPKNKLRSKLNFPMRNYNVIDRKTVKSRIRVLLYVMYGGRGRSFTVY